MTRSYKKPYVWCSKPSYQTNKRACRHYHKQACHEMGIDFDPDRDFDEFHKNSKTFDDWGTKLGFDFVPGDSDSTWMHETYRKMVKK